ncbi:rho GTPase-activating protein REN1-like isoform X3 [Euphorbia lathyris]|uniref:rho GTPase-activating protein REN1-like isoform X3 n=1 Tax=Euphorbia lathyris TaxID=212925 RepID=UPI003313D294
MTINKAANTESSQGDVGAPRTPPGHPPQGPYENVRYRTGNTVLKSGPLFISSKGIGWTSWKKRWFILTRTSLVFFRSDPSVVPQRGSEVNLTLGGIDLNNSGSVVVKADKRLLTVLFPDGRDGRAFTLKAETSDDLYEWKTALENALSQAPSSALTMGQNGILKNDQTDSADAPFEQSKDKVPAKGLVLGRPVLLALEDVDGSPSFLEKALRFIEEYGIKVEGILRQAAAVDDVEHRIREFEQGKTEFSSTEDAHVIADCVKYFLRELPSSPVPASCCNALLEAFRKSVGRDRSNRVNNMRVAILETFPEPNRRLLERILLMMQLVASHKSENRMSTSAVAACMAPLLLRPLLAGECEIENDFDMGGDGSIQLLQAAAAANHAQAIVITLLEEYDKIFGEAVMSPGLYSDSEECESEDEEVTDDDESYEDDDQDDVYTDDDLNDASTGTVSDDDHLLEDKMQGGDDLRSLSKPPKVANDSKFGELSNSVQTSLPSPHHVARDKNFLGQSKNNLTMQTIESDEIISDNEQTGDPSACIQKNRSMSNGPVHEIRSPTHWGRLPAKKNLSLGSVDFSSGDEDEIAKLEATKTELQQRISEEVKGNEALQTSLGQKKKVLHERRLVLEQDVARLQEELQRERDKRAVLERGLSKSDGPVPPGVDEKIMAEVDEINHMEADVTNLEQKVDDLNLQLNQQREQNNSSSHEQSKHPSQNQQPDPAPNSDSKSSTNSRSSTNSKRSSLRSEGVNSTASALSKLTTRLNFLKERRVQLSTAPTVGSPVHRGSDTGQAPRTADKSQGPEVRVVQNSDRGRGSEGSRSDKGLRTEGQSHKN